MKVQKHLSKAYFGQRGITFIYALSYDSTYESVYSECKKRRITLAEKLRKLPLAFFGKKDLSDLTSTIMNDVNALEMIFAHAVPEIFAVAAMLVICAIALIIYNPLMSAALLWVAPFAGLLIYLSRKLQFKNFKMYGYNESPLTMTFRKALKTFKKSSPTAKKKASAKHWMTTPSFTKSPRLRANSCLESS